MADITKQNSTPSRGVFQSQFASFIIAKPDPLVEVLTELGWAYDDNGSKMAAELRKAIEARGGKIVWGAG